MVIEDLRAALAEIVTLKHSDVYDLRIASSYAEQALIKLQDPVKFRQALRDSIYYISIIIRRYAQRDPNLKRLDEVMKEWWHNLRPGPRKFGTNPHNNPADNPITMPDGDEIPGSVVYQYAIEHHYGRDFGEEMTNLLVTSDYKAKTDADVKFLLKHMSWKVKQAGTVFYGTQEQVDPVRTFLRRQEIAYNKFPREKFADVDEFVIWVPLYQRDEAKQLLKDARFTR